MTPGTSPERLVINKAVTKRLIVTQGSQSVIETKVAVTHGAITTDTLQVGERVSTFFLVTSR